MNIPSSQLRVEGAPFLFHYTDFICMEFELSHPRRNGASRKSEQSSTAAFSPYGFRSWRTRGLSCGILLHQFDNF